MATELESIGNYKNDIKKATNEFVLIIERYQKLTDELLNKLENMTDRAVTAEFKNKLVEAYVSSGLVITQTSYERLIKDSVRGDNAQSN